MDIPARLRHESLLIQIWDRVGRSVAGDEPVARNAKKGF